MAKRRRTFNNEMKQATVAEIEAALASGAIKDRKAELRKRGLSDSIYYRWRREFPPKKNTTALIPANPAAAAEVFSVQDILAQREPRKPTNPRRATAANKAGAGLSAREQFAAAVVTLLNKILGVP